MSLRSLLVSTVVFVGFLSSPAHAGIAKSVAESSSLSEYLALASDVASEGPSLEWFGFEENTSRPQGAACQSGTVEDAARYLVGMTGAMDWAPLATKARWESLENSAMSELRTLLGGGAITMCVADFASEYSLTVVNVFESGAGDYRIAFRAGYEN